MPVGATMQGRAKRPPDARPAATGTDPTVATKPAIRPPVASPPTGVGGGSGGPVGGAVQPNPGFWSGGFPSAGKDAEVADPAAAGDIKNAIGSLQAQLGMPGSAGMAPGGSGPIAMPGISGPGGASMGGAPGEPPWMALKRMGVGGQGSPMANRQKLAELMAARRGGMSPGLGRAGMGGAQTNFATIDGQGGPQLSNMIGRAPGPGAPGGASTFDISRLPNEAPGGPNPPMGMGGRFGGGGAGAGVGGPDYTSLIRQRLSALGPNAMGGIAY